MKKNYLNNIPYVTRSHRVGIFVLSIIIALLQLIYFVFLNSKSKSLLVDTVDTAWMREQVVLDSLNEIRHKETILYPFNPNYISDYKAYALGMTVEEVDRLLDYRAKNQYVNSAEEFQLVTGVSKQWLVTHEKYFKFPVWKSNTVNENLRRSPVIQDRVVLVKEINTATAEDLMKIRGIGPVFSERIISERKKIGGFIRMKQLDFIWGLSEETIGNLRKSYDVLDEPVVSKININTASLNEINKIPYINYHIARSIVIYRSSNGDFKDLEEFENIKDFPLDKLEIISLYLAF